jgi:hypothetical protein
MLRMCLAAFLRLKLRLFVGSAPDSSSRLPDTTHHG